MSQARSLLDSLCTSSVALVTHLSHLLPRGSILSHLSLCPWRVGTAERGEVTGFEWS